MWSIRALSRLRVLFRVGAWCSVPGTHVLSFSLCRGQTLTLRVLSHCVSVRSRVRSAARSSVHVCYTQFVFYWMHAFMLCLVLCGTQLVFFQWLCAFVLLCLAWTRGLWVFSLAVCSGTVLHMAGDLFCWHMTFLLDFRVPCALMLIVMTPPILLPDYWLILPTCVFFVTFLICSLYNLLVFAVLCQFVVDVTLPCLALPCLALPCLALPCLALPCRQLRVPLSYMVV